MKTHCVVAGKIRGTFQVDIEHAKVGCVCETPSASTKLFEGDRGGTGESVNLITWSLTLL